MTEEEKKRRGEELKRRRQAENKAKGAHKTSARPDAPRATTGQEDTNAALEAATQGVKRPETADAQAKAVSTGTSAKAAGIAANGEKETQTTEPYGPQLPEGLRHDPEMDGQFVDSFIQARLRGPQAFAAWVDTLPLPGSGAKETAAAPLFAQTNGGDVQPVETVDGQGDAAQEPDEVGLVEAALDRVEGANAEAETEENGPTPALTEELTEEPMPQPTPGPTPEPTPGPTEEPTEEPRPQPMPGPTPGPTPEPEQGTQTESTEEPTPELAAEQPLEESATLQQATPALEDGVSAAEQETEPDGAAEEIDLWSANTDYVAGIDTQLKEIRERIAAIDGELAEGPNEALSAEREQLVESQKQLRSDRARGVGKWTVAEELVQSIQEQWETLQAQFDAGDYRAFIEDEELWDAVKDDPESAKYAAQTELGRRQKELNLQSTVVLAHQPHDDETRFYRSTADSSWLKMLYDREIALQSGDTARVQEINAAMDAAGFEKKWPEEVAAEKRLQEEMIAYQREQGDEVTRQKLGYAADRKLTDEDYLRAAQIDGDFTMFNLWHDPKAIADFFSLSGDVNLFEEIGKNGIFGGLFSYTEKSKEGYEDRLNQAVQIIIGDGASYAQTKNAKDILSVVPSVSGGAIQGVLSIADALPFVITEMYYQVNKNRLGTEESWEQMRMDDWFFNVMCMVRDFSSDVMDSMDVDVSARSKWVGMAEGVSYTVAQNLRIYELSRGVANLLVSNFAHTIPQAGKLFTTVRLVTQDVGFWMTGYKSCVQEALVAGATQEEAFWYGVVGASISAAVERIDDLGGRYWGSADSATQGLMKYFEGRGEKWKWVESMADSFLGERVESRIEDPLQALAQKILYDPDKPWYGEDGVFDPERSNEAARISGIGGLILGGLGGISARRAQIQAQGGVDVETGNPNTKAIESAAKAAAALGDENSSQKTQNIATKVLDSVTENGDAPEYMMKALEDARTEDIAAKATGGKAAKSREELGKAQDGLKEKIGKRSIAEANVQKQEQWLLGMKKALKENPTPENLKAYQKAQADHRAAQQQLERAQQEVIAQQRAVNGWKEQADADYKTSQQDKVKLEESIRGVQDGIAALPQEQQAGLRELWQKNVEALGIDEGTAATLEAVQEARKAAAEVEAEKTESQNISEETGDLQETTDANGDIMEEDKGENTFVNMEAGASDVSGGTDESNDVLPKAVVLKGNYSETYQNKLQNVYEQIIPLGYKPTEHSLNRILGRMKQGKFDSLQDVIDTLQTGTKYWDPEYGGYVMYKNEISIHITEDGIITTVIGKAKIKDTWEEIK